MGFLTAWEASGFSQWVQESDYGFYILLALHALGMAAMVGPILMLAARALGFADELQFAAFDRLLSVAWGGFLVDLASGLALFGLHGPRLVASAVFLTKMVLIVAGALATRQLARCVYAGVAPDEAAPSRALAWATIAIWLLVIFVGRLVGYTVYSSA